MSGRLDASIYEGGKWNMHALLFLPGEQKKYLLKWHTFTLGSNLSQGQRQLVSLARALLTPTNILGKTLKRNHSSLLDMLTIRYK